MDLKINNKYLLVFVILLYSASIVLFFKLRSNDTDTILLTNTLGNFTPKNYEVKEDFAIANNHRDPFLGKLPTARTPKKTSSKPVKVQKTPEYYPTVQYKGLVSDTDSNKKVVSLAVNGQEYIIREGKTVDSVTIISGDPKELKVSYKGAIKKFKITN